MEKEEKKVSKIESKKEDKKTKEQDGDADRIQRGLGENHPTRRDGFIHKW